VNRSVMIPALLVPLALIAGCSSSGSATPAGQQMAGGGNRSCGTTRSGANVPVIVQVAKGSVACGTAMQVEKSYATAIEHGELRGNGGGAPLKVDGWTCQGYPTPEVLRSGDASECTSGGSKILAVLDVPSS
jgi:hypothetical protein